MATASQFQERLTSDLSITILNGQTVSQNALDTNGTSLVGYVLPAIFDGTSITFQVSETKNGAYSDLYNTDGTQISHTIAQGRAVAISPLDFAGWRFIKFVSNSAETADRTITIQSRPL